MQMITLLRDPIYRAYFLKAPRFPHPVHHETPWTVWVKRTRNERVVWAKKDVPTFREAFTFVKPHIKEWDDFSITSRIISFFPPKNVRHAYRHLQWCYRCRRPTTFKPYARHHALKPEVHRYFADWPVCPYCGCKDDTEHRTYPG